MPRNLTCDFERIYYEEPDDDWCENCDDDARFCECNEPDPDAAYDRWREDRLGI